MGVIMMLPPDLGAHAERRRSPPVTRLEKLLRSMSVFTMLMTVPQVSAIWVGRDAHNVSLLSWAGYLVSACLWFAYGLRKRDRTIYVACIGWILLDAAIVIGVVLYG
jgi:uncharacterized protein with PQ loop repeat